MKNTRRTIIGIDLAGSPKRNTGICALRGLTVMTYATVHVPWGAALVLQGILAFGVAIPSSPGFFGVFEGATRAALAMYGVAKQSAVSLALGYHIAGFVPITLLGLWSLWSADLRLRDLGAAGAVGETGRTGEAGRTGERKDERAWSSLDPSIRLNPQRA